MVDSVDLMKVNEIGTGRRLEGVFPDSYNRARGLISVGCSGWKGDCMSVEQYVKFPLWDLQTRLRSSRVPPSDWHRPVYRRMG